MKAKKDTSDYFSKTGLPLHVRLINFMVRKSTEKSSLGDTNIDWELISKWTFLVNLILISSVFSMY
jgi:hypothetical protein